MAFILPPLPYAKNALAPHISEQTIEFHYGKHHQTYVTNLNNLVQGSENESENLEDLIKMSAGKADMVGIFNNAAQVWNHTFFWHSMRPNGGGKPSGALLSQINNDFGSYEDFAEQMKTAGATQFGSGWAWLVHDLNDGKLKVTKTANAENPMTKNQLPLLTCDVWEHAYYLDYQNRRPDYINVFLSELVNWEFAETIFEQYHGNKKA